MAVGHVELSCSKLVEVTWQRPVVLDPIYLLVLSWIMRHCTLSSPLVILCLDYCNMLYIKLPLKRIQKPQLEQNAITRTVLPAPRDYCVTPLLHELQCLVVCFQAQFKVLVNSFKALYGMGSGYLRNRFTPVGLAHFTCSNTRMLQITSIKELQPVGIRRRAFFAVAPTVWKFMLLEVRSVPTLLAF